MQRDGERRTDFFPRARNHGHNARGRERDAAFGKRQRIAIGDNGEGGFHIVEIVERFAHAHHHHIGDAAARRAARPIIQRIARNQHLADDFARREIAHEFLGAGVTEAAIERAADLAGDAERAAVRIGDEDHLVILAVRRAEQPFARAVIRNLFGHRFGAGEREAFAKLRAEILCQIAHRLEVARAVDIDPVPQLAHAHGCGLRIDAGFNQRRFEFGRREPDQRCLLYILHSAWAFFSAAEIPDRE